MSNYLKRYAAPRSWTLLRKEKAYIVKTRPGPHPLEQSMPLGLLLKQLGHAGTTPEAKKILQRQVVIVDGRRIRDHRFPVGLMDVISLPAAEESYRMTLDTKGRLMLNKVDKKTTMKPCRVIGKRTITGGKTQLNLVDGRNVLTDKTDVRVGDTVVLELPKQRVMEALPLKAGSTILLTAGKHVGKTGTVDAVGPEQITFTVGVASERTLKRYAFVVPEGLL
jgi:small subunit ribosomal protein S4e